MHRHLAILLSSLITLVIGCGEKQQQPPPPAPKLAASKLTVLVVEDPGISAGLKLLRGEWLERSGGELAVEETSSEQFLASSELAADLVIYPSRYVGTLVARDWLRPVRKSVLESDDVAVDDMFPLIRDQVIQHGGEVYCLSLGEPPLMLGHAREATDSKRTAWSDLPNPQTVENSQLPFPLAIAFLARGAAYVQSRSGSAELFDSATMEPRLGEPPYTRALEEMIAAGQASADGVNQVSLGWPTSKRPDSRDYVALPVAEEVYRPLRDAWETNELAQPVTFLGVAGRCVSVSRTTRNSASAFKLLGWIGAESVASQLSPRSEATLWFRKSQAKKANKWSGADASDATSAVVAELLSSEYFFLLPRVPGIDEYLKSLDAEIQAAIAENQSAETALAEVASVWEAITDRLGRESQRLAYRMHLGLDE